MIDSLPLPVIQYYGAVGCRQVVRHETLTLALRWFDPSHPSQKKSESSAFGFFICAEGTTSFAQIFAKFYAQGKAEISRDFSRFFDPEFFSEFHRSLLPFSMLCPDSDSRKGLFCIFPKAIGFVAGFGLAKAEPDSAKKSPLHKLFTTKPQNLIIISLLRAFLARWDSFPS